MSQTKSKAPTKLWNLTELGDLQEVVVSPSIPASGSRKAHRGKPGKRPAYIRVALSVAALGASLAVGAIQANGQNFSMAVPSASIAQSVPVPRPPLDEYFGDRFVGPWTEEAEAQLLFSVEQRRAKTGSAQTLDEKVDAIYWNELEELTPGLARLDKGKVSGLLRGKRK